MHIDLIREADSDIGARLSARGAESYLQALYFAYPLHTNAVIYP